MFLSLGGFWNNIYGFIFNYKINAFSDTVKVGFLLNTFDKLKINYIVYENEIVLKGKFSKNKYDIFLKSKLSMDDGVLLSNNKEYLKYRLSKIEGVVNKYKLKLNKKTKIINVNREGIDFLGFRFNIINNKIIMYVRRNTKKRFKRKMKAIKNGKIPEDKGGQIINSYKGHFKWGNCYNLINKSSKF